MVCLLILRSPLKYIIAAEPISKAALPGVCRVAEAGKKWLTGATKRANI
jgi:hypothetical protein